MNEKEKKGKRYFAHMCIHLCSGRLQWNDCVFINYYVKVSTASRLLHEFISYIQIPVRYESFKMPKLYAIKRGNSSNNRNAYEWANTNARVNEHENLKQKQNHQIQKENELHVKIQRETDTTK